MVFPPSESCNRRVSLESLYGICPPFLLYTRAFITLPSAVKERLILAPSFRVSPVAPVLPCLYDPARSTKLSLEALTLSPFSND